MQAVLGKKVGWHANVNKLNSEFTNLAKKKMLEFWLTNKLRLRLKCYDLKNMV